MAQAFRYENTAAALLAWRSRTSPAINAYRQDETLSAQLPPA
jgi:hypothetical protein